MKTKPLMLSIVSAAVLLCASAATPVLAQPAVPTTAPEYQPLSDQQLDQLLGPIALYPDPLLSEILPAATLPAQIVLADRYVASGADPNLIDQQGWDASVVALTHYPTVLKYLDDNLAWTTELGEAFMNQQEQVLESVQRLRLSAQNFGNLVSTPQEQVVDDNGDIEILPASPDVIYIPVYQPVYVYDESGFAPTFAYPCAIGAWLGCDFDWVNHSLRHWGHDHYRPANWWSETPAQRQATLAVETTVWHPRHHPGTVAGGQGNRAWANSTTPGYNSQNNHTVVYMPSHGATPRAAATPMPAAVPRPSAVREQGGFQLPSQPAPVVTQVDPRDFGGGDNSRDARNYSAPVSEPPRVEPPHAEPVQPEAPHVDPPHVDPPHYEAPAPPPPPPPQSDGGSHDSRH